MPVQLSCGDTVGDTLTEDAGTTTLPGDTQGRTLTEDAGATTLPGSGGEDTLTEDAGTTTPTGTLIDDISGYNGTHFATGNYIDGIYRDAGTTLLWRYCLR